VSDIIIVNMRKWNFDFFKKKRLLKLLYHSKNNQKYVNQPFAKYVTSELFRAKKEERIVTYTKTTQDYTHEHDPVSVRARARARAHPFEYDPVSIYNQM